MKTKILVVGLMCLLSSCVQRQDCETLSLENYSIEVKFSSFFDCGVFERLVITSLPGKLTYSERFKLNKLYQIRLKDNCKVPHGDTVIIETLKIQRDSLFYLANAYLESIKFNSQIISCDPVRIQEDVKDGANIEIRVCFENQCKSSEYYHYRDVEKISPELNAFMSYMDRIK